MVTFRVKNPPITTPEPEPDYEVELVQDDDDANVFLNGEIVAWFSGGRKKLYLYEKDLERLGVPYDGDKKGEE